MNEPILAVKKDTWHFKYFRFIRGLWGMDVPARTSLCPYCQTMFWFSVAAILLSPMIILGWSLMKFIRLAYKSFAYLGMNWAVDLMDKMDLGSAVEKYSQKSEEAPLPATILFSAGAIAIVCLTALLLGGVAYGLFFLVTNIPNAPAFFLKVFSFLGWLFFMAMALVGYLLHHAWYGIRWFFTNGPMWASIAYWTSVLVALGVGSVITIFVTHKVSETRFGAWVISKIMLRLNGFGEARKAAKKRRELALEAKVMAELVAATKEKAEPGVLCRAWCWVKEGLFNQRVKIGKSAGVALGFFGIIWEFAKAVKRNVCPIVDFLPDGSEPPPPPEPKMDPPYFCYNYHGDYQSTIENSEGEEDYEEEEVTDETEEDEDEKAKEEKK